MWRQIDFNMFDDDEVLPKIVSALIKLLDLTECDTAQAIANIKKVRKDRTKHDIDPEKQRFIDQHYPQSLPEPAQLVPLPNKNNK